MFLAIFIWDIADGSGFPAAPSLYKILVNGTGISILVIGYGTGLALGLLAALRSGSPRLLRAVPAMPLYWLLVSFASWRALWELFTDPHHWHKTEHGAALSRKPKRPAA